MSDNPERDRVDRYLDSAESRLREARAAEGTDGGPSADAVLIAGVLADIGGALASQIRDADDTQANRVAEGIVSGLADLGVVAGENLTAIHGLLERILARAGERKGGGLFG